MQIFLDSIKFLLRNLREFHARRRREDKVSIMKQITSKVILGVPCYALRYFCLEPTPAMKYVGRYSEKIAVSTTIQHFNFSKINRHLMLSSDGIFKA